MHVRRRVAALGAAAMTLVALAGCQSSQSAGAGNAVSASPSPLASSGAARPHPSATTQVQVTVTPADSATDVRLDAPVTVSVADGTVESVELAGVPARTAASTKNGSSKKVPTVEVTGTLTADGHSWAADQLLEPSTTYSVAVVTRDATGARSDMVSSFTTLTPDKELVTSISPLGGQTVGVGMPIIVRLNHDVPDDRRALVQQHLQVESTPAVEGAWSWISAREVHYRPEVFWPARTKVSVTTSLTGLDLDDGLWGHSSRTVAFDIGDSMVSTIDVVHHSLTVKRNGALFMKVPVTSGKANFLTRNGTKVILEKFVTKTMDAATTGTAKNSKDYYRLEVPYAMRVTWTGEFLHAAPWSTGSQGRTNVSHGCVGMSVANAKRLFAKTRVGDVVVVVGSPRKLEPNNGWTDWNVDWTTWLAGSAT